MAGPPVNGSIVIKPFTASCGFLESTRTYVSSAPLPPPVHCTWLFFRLKKQIQPHDEERIHRGHCHWSSLLHGGVTVRACGSLTAVLEDWNKCDARLFLS